MSASYGCPDTGATDRGSALLEELQMPTGCALYRVGSASNLGPTGSPDRMELMEKLGLIQEQVLTVTRELAAFRGEVAQIRAMAEESEPGCFSQGRAHREADPSKLVQLQRRTNEMQGSLRACQGTCDTRYATLLQRIGSCESGAAGIAADDSRYASLAMRVDALDVAVAGLASGGHRSALGAPGAPEVSEDRLEAIKKSLVDIWDKQTKDAAETRNRLDEMYGMLDEHQSELVRVSQEAGGWRQGLFGSGLAGAMSVLTIGSPKSARASADSAASLAMECQDPAFAERLHQVEWHLSSLTDRTAADMRASHARLEQVQKGLAEHRTVALEVEADRASLQKCVKELESVLRRPLGVASDEVVARQAQGSTLDTSLREESLPVILRRLESLEGGVTDLRSRLAPLDAAVRSKTPPAGVVCYPAVQQQVGAAHAAPSAMVPAPQPRSPTRLVISPRPGVAFSSPPRGQVSPGPMRPAPPGSAVMAQSPPLAQPRLPATLRGRPPSGVAATLGTPAQTPLPRPPGAA